METKDKRSVLYLIIVILVVLLLVIDIAFNINRKIVQTTNITKTEKEVTITDEGIAESVDKLYDATVIVEILQDKKVASWGSGFVYKADDNNAYVVTNYHVTEGTTAVQIEFTDGTTTNGTVIGGDEYTDVSVVKIDSKSIKKVAEIGSSNDLKLGDTVFAIGSPISMNLKFTVTRGVLSGTNRLLPMTSSSSNNSIYSRYVTSQESWYIKLLQIDASINSGNSGGPLANANGQVVGITNSKLSSSSIENIGFAVPIEDVSNIADQVINDGKVTRPYAGVGYTSIEQGYLSGLITDTDYEYGVVIGTVEDGSPADKAGLKVGDVITMINDDKVLSTNHFKYYVNRYKVGDKINITYIRGGATKTTEIELGKKS